MFYWTLYWYFVQTLLMLVQMKEWFWQELKQLMIFGTKNG